MKKNLEDFFLWSEEREGKLRERNVRNIEG